MSIVIDGYPFKKYRWEHGRFGYREPSYRALKQFLVKEYRVCYFCGVSVTLYDYVEGRGLPDDAATIDHLKPRGFRKRYQIVEKVLACYKCNHDRNVKQQKSSEIIGSL